MSELRSLYHSELTLLQGLAASTSLPAALRERARLILLGVQGRLRGEIAQRLGCTSDTVRKWTARFNAEGALGLFDRPRSGAPYRHTGEAAWQVVEAATTRPDTLGLPFSSWTLAKRRRYLGERQQIWLSREGWRQLLARHDLSWKKAQSGQQSPDPHFAERKEAIVPLYTAPPAGALVLCVDQKGPVQIREYPGGGYARKGKAPRRNSE